MTPRTPLRLFRKPLRRTAIVVLVAAVFLGGVVWFFGLDVPGSIVVAAAGATVGLTWIAVQEGDAILWPALDKPRTPGARRELQQLGWSMRTRGGVHEKTVARAREAARHRLLFLYGLDLDAEADRPAIEQVLAPGVVRMLLTTRAVNIDITQFTRCLSALEALGRERSPEPGDSPATITPTERHS